MSSNSASDERTLLPSPTLKQHSEDGAARAGGQYVTPEEWWEVCSMMSCGPAAAAGPASAVTCHRLLLLLRQGVCVVRDEFGSRGDSGLQTDRSSEMIIRLIDGDVL